MVDITGKLFIIAGIIGRPGYPVNGSTATATSLDYPNYTNKSDYSLNFYPFVNI